MALCDFDPLKRDLVANKYPECRFYDSADTLINQADIDVISVASYDHHHADHVLSSIHAGLHVFCEKPLCLTEQELTKIKAALALRPELRLASNTILRKSERFQDVRARIMAGELGILYNVEADYNYGRLYKLLQGWRGEIRDYSVMLGGGIHMVDLLAWLVDSPIIEVSAIGNKICSRGASFETPDMVLSWLKFSNGTIGKVGANFGCIHPHFHRVSLYGTNGTFVNGIDEGLIYTNCRQDAVPSPVKSAYPGVNKGDLIPDFVSSIITKGSARLHELDPFAAVSVCLAVDKSLKSGRPEFVNSQ